MIVSGNHVVRVGLLLLLLLVSLAAKSKELTGVTADGIIAKAVVRASTIRSKGACPEDTYTKVNVTEDLDTKGKIRERKERVFQVKFQAATTRVKSLGGNGTKPPREDVAIQVET